MLAPRDRDPEDDAPEEEDAPDDAYEPTYPDGSVKHECWNDRE